MDHSILKLTDTFKMKDLYLLMYDSNSSYSIADFMVERQDTLYPWILECARRSTRHQRI